MWKNRQRSNFLQARLKIGIYQIRVQKEVMKKTAFKPKYGRYEFLIMPLGPSNALTTFQSLVNTLFGAWTDGFMVLYLNHTLLYSVSYEKHIWYIDIVLQRLQDNKFYVGKFKYELLSCGTAFSGVLQVMAGVIIDGDRKKINKEFPMPKKLTGIRSFIGLLRFFRQFIKDFYEIARTLTYLTRENAKINKCNK